MDTPTETLIDAGPAPGKKTNWLSRLWPLGLLVIGLATIYFSGAYKYLSIDTLQTQRETLKAFVSDYLLFAVVGFILIYALATIFMLPGALWITIAGGFLFGLVGGSLATVTGATLGATTLFFIARTSVGEPLRKRAGPFLRKVEAGFKDGAISYMFF
ncbi:MAG: TVP38/TMEM64 family protein, partial [Ponticaulis sp.]|nr:TVP38/TMEM64 family protein [Ponticaulis sp.]